MYKIEIQFEQKNKDVSNLTAYEVTDKNITKFEKAIGSILKDYIQKAIFEFNKEFKKDNDILSINGLELDNVLKDLLNDLKETMKDKKKED